MAKRYRISFTCSEKDVTTFTGLLIKEVKGLTVTEIEETKPPLYPPLPKKANGNGVTVIPPARTRTPGGQKTTDSKPGQACLSVFKRHTIAHGPDFAEALENKGYAGTSWGAVLSRLMREGAVVRVGHGSYRLPTPTEALEVIDSRKQELHVT